MGLFIKSIIEILMWPALILSLSAINPQNPLKRSKMSVNWKLEQAKIKYKFKDKKDMGVVNSKHPHPSLAGLSLSCWSLVVVMFCKKTIGNCWAFPVLKSALPLHDILLMTWRQGDIGHLIRLPWQNVTQTIGTCTILILTTWWHKELISTFLDVFLRPICQCHLSRKGGERF